MWCISAPEFDKEMINEKKSIHRQLQNCYCSFAADGEYYIYRKH